MKFDIDNGYLVYEVYGRGTPFLFIHGYPLSRRIWDPQVEALSKIATIITVDLRGHGASAGRTNRFGWQGTHDVGAAVAFLGRTRGRCQCRPRAVPPSYSTARHP